MRIKIKNSKHSTLFIFDIDDTLVKSTARIKRTDNATGEVSYLEQAVFNKIGASPQYSYDFAEFADAKKFAEESRPLPMLEVVNAIGLYLSHGKMMGKIILITARQNMDDKEVFLEFFRKYELPVDNQKIMRIERAGVEYLNEGGKRSMGDVKSGIARKYLDEGLYKRCFMVDDSRENLDSFIKLAPEYPGVKFSSYIVENTLPKPYKIVDIS